MAFSFQRVPYAKMNARQKETYNFQKISAALADFGFTTMRLSADWKGADFLAHHHNGETIKIQLKGRASFEKKYCAKDVWICFPRGDEWYLYPHDEVLQSALANTNIGNTKSWNKKGGYSYPRLSKKMLKLLDPYRLPALPSTGLPAKGT